MKILIADALPESCLKSIKELGHEINCKPELNEEKLPSSIKGYNCLIVRGKRVTEETINKSDVLSLIIRAGEGINTIDIDAAANKAVFVVNTPGRNAVAVAELAFGLLLAIDRNIPDNVHDLRKSQWNKARYSKSAGLFGRTAGIIGLGEAGIAFAERARAFGMKLMAFDPIAELNKTPKISEMIISNALTFCPSLDSLAANSDIVTIHLPSNPHTIRMVNRDFLKNMKENAILINTSRGEIIDDEALIEVMNSKNIRAGLDVFNGEPASEHTKFETPLSTHPNVYGTHHIGACTVQAQNSIGSEIIEILRNYENGVVLNCVNVEFKPISTYAVIARIYDKVGVLASMLELLKKEGVSVQQMDSKVFNGETAQHIVLFLNKEPGSECIEAISRLPEVIEISFKNIILHN